MPRYKALRHTMYSIFNFLTRNCIDINKGKIFPTACQLSENSIRRRVFGSRHLVILLLHFCEAARLRGRRRPEGGAQLFLPRGRGDELQLLSQWVNHLKKKCRFNNFFVGKMRFCVVKKRLFWNMKPLMLVQKEHISLVEG